MRQHILHDVATTEYTVALDSLWSDWEPWLVQLEKVLHRGTAELEQYDNTAEFLRQAQYHAHTTSEFCAGLVPPVVASEAHDYLLAVMQACRDTLGVLAMRVDLDEMDEQTLEIGLHAVSSTRDAFHASRYSSMAASAFTESLQPMVVQGGRQEERGWGVLLWMLAATCAVLFAVLLFQLTQMP